MNVSNLKPHTIIAALAMLVLALALLTGGLWLAAALLVLVGVGWLVGQRRGWSSASDLGLAACVCASGWGVWQALGATWLLFGLVLALGAWDMERFALLLAQAGRVDHSEVLWREHLRRLGLVLGAGLLLSLLALNLRVALNFGWIIGLALLAVLGLSRAIRLLRQG